MHGASQEKVHPPKVVRFEGSCYHLNKGSRGAMVTTYERVNYFQEKINELLKEQMGKMIVLGMVRTFSLLSYDKSPSSGR